MIELSRIVHNLAVYRGWDQAREWRRFRVAWQMLKSGSSVGAAIAHIDN